MTKHIDFANMRDSLKVVAMRLQNTLRVMTEEKVMLKTITKTKQMRLDELIRYVWDNLDDLLNGYDVMMFYSRDDKGVAFDKAGFVECDDEVDKDDLFEVEIEEEITEDTEFEKLYAMMDYKRVYTTHNIKTVKEIKEYFNFSGELELLHQIYAMVDGKLELIWESREE